MRLGTETTAPTYYALTPPPVPRGSSLPSRVPVPAGVGAPAVR